MTAGPTLRPMRVAGLGIADARELRIAVEDGALVVRRPGRDPEVVGSAGSVQRAVWLDAAQSRRVLFHPRSRAFDDWSGGSVVISGTGGVALSFLVDDFVPWGGDPAQRRESSGAVGLVRALGLVLEAADPQALPPGRAARAALVAPHAGAAAAQGISLGLTLLAGLLAFLSWPYGGSVVGLVLNLGSLLAIGPVLLLLVRHQRRFESLVGRPPDADGRLVCPLPDAVVGQLPSQLQIGERDVVMVDAGGRELWLPGPAAGGVASCVVGDEALCLLDARGILLLALAADQMVPDEASRGRLEQAARSVGISVTADPFLLPASGTPVDLRPAIDRPGLWMTEWERGRISGAVDVLLPLAAVLQLVGAGAAAYSFPPWGYLALAGSAGWLGVRLWTGLGYRRWQHDVRRRGAG